MKRLLIIFCAMILVLGMIGMASANTKESSTMWFQGSLTDMGSGIYSGVLPMIDEGATNMGDGISGYDIYGQDGATAWFGDDPLPLGDPVWTSLTIANHYGWPTWNPDTPDWYQYSLELYQDGIGQYKWAVRNHPGATAAHPWYDPYWGAGGKPPAGVPMSGMMDWTNMIAGETDIGAYLPGTGTPMIPGGAASKGSCAGAWDMDWSWGTELAPLECSVFKVNIVDLGGGIYRVSLTPPSNTWYWKDYNGPEVPGGYMPEIDQNQDFDNVQVRTEETDPVVSLNGTWGTTTDPQASGGSLKYTKDSQAFCTFSFNGSSIKWIGAKAYNRGQAEVWIDGQLMATVSQYDQGVLWQQIIYSNTNLTSGPHTIMIKPIDAPDKYIDVDAFDVDDIEKEYCAPVAEANSLWWLDKAHGLGIFEFPCEGQGYIGDDVNGDGVADILDFVQELAWFKDTNGQRTGEPHTGTTTEDEQAGIEAFLEKYNLSEKLYEHTVYDGEYETCQEYFTYLEDEVKRCQDVKLDLGFWHVEEVIFDEGPPPIWTVIWKRMGGHAVTVAGVDSPNFLFAISDPDNDRAEAGLNPGFVRTPPGATHPYPHEPALHNDERYASHDIYTVGSSPSPGGKCGLLNYPFKWNFPEQEQIIVPIPYFEPPEVYPCMTFTEIEAAVIVSPIICGNGNVDPGEECDDGNLIPGDGCSPVCKLEICGNGILDFGEECDDGNTNNGDGCDDLCKIPDISTVQAMLNYMYVIAGGSSTKTLTVSNTGNGKLTIGTITIGGTNPDKFSIMTDNCSGHLISPSNSCAVDVKFSPTSTGKKTATLNIPSDDPEENPLTVLLKGKGAKLLVTSPNGGEILDAGSTHTITWQTSGIIGTVAKVVLKYTTNGGSTWNLITNLSVNTGSYPWEVPWVSSTKCKVKVVLQNASGVILAEDKSDSKFTIK